MRLHTTVVIDNMLSGGNFRFSETTTLNAAHGGKQLL